MSLMTINNALDLVACATPESPIAIFKTQTPAVFNVMFANTVIARAFIESDDPYLIGVFDNTMSENQVRNRIRECQR